jgi:DDE superfamily endonuclease/Helix-turn-helix of DDE superfamily endonuclease
MITYGKLAKKPSVFKSITGITLAEFDDLEKKFCPKWEQAEEKRLNRPKRQRAIGAGHPYRLALSELLLLTLVWLRLYVSLDALGFLFSIDKATASRNTRRVLLVLRQLGDETLGWSEPPKRGHGKNIDEVLREYPDLLAIIDATEQPIERASDNDTQKAHYSGKKKRHTRKTQIIVNEHGEIREVSLSVPGSVHDLELFRQSGSSKTIPEKITAGGDSGYQGLHDELPKHSVFVPHKATRGHPLMPDQKFVNRELSSIRIKVENTLAELKHFKVLADRFRHSTDIYDNTFRAVVALVNPRITRRLLPAA